MTQNRNDGHSDDTTFVQTHYAGTASTRDTVTTSAVRVKRINIRTLVAGAILVQNAAGDRTIAFVRMNTAGMFYTIPAFYSPDGLSLITDPVSGVGTARFQAIYVSL
jgi:hypothetical protein